MYKRLAIATSVFVLGLGLPARAVDGVIEINQSSVSGVVNQLHVITTPGTHRLTSDLVAPEDSGGIRIDVGDVTLDLNGFTLSGSGTGFLDGISTLAVDNIEIRNGTVQGFPRHGIQSTDDHIRIIDVRSIGNGLRGISLESGVGGLVRGCTVSASGAEGIRVLSDGSLVMDNVARGNTKEGLFLGATIGYGGNVVTGNNSGGAQVNASGKIIACNLLETTVSCPP